MEQNTTPGDGGAACIPLHFAPTQAKEILMLGKTHTGRQLADMGIINYAVPADQLDRVTDDIVQRLLQRSAYALAWSKRVINQHYVDNMNKVLTSAIAYEMVDLFETAQNRGKAPTTLT
jgi:enoyl-CoA hydratase